MNKFLTCLLFLFFAQLKVFAVVEDFLKDDIKTFETPDTNLDYNYKSIFSIPIKLQITEKISTKDNNLYEGKELNFKIKESVFYRHHAILKKNEIIKGKIKYITKSGMNGIPYEIVLDDFEFKNIDSDKIKSEYRKEGFNRTYFVMPLKWALTILPPTGSLTNFIKGGHAKITPKDEITLYYFPDWK